MTRPPSSPASDPPLAERLATRIQAGGPLAFSDFMDAALYAPDGFYESGGSAGRRGDFLTSPEVGPLFGAVIARALDGWWDELGAPDPYVVVDAGAGPGTLARSIRVAAPRCASALRLVLVERSAAQRVHHPPGVESRSDLPDRADVILANELLDNLPFDIVEHDGTQWREVLVDWRDGRFLEVPGPAVDLVFTGTRLPLPRAAAAWIADARRRCQRLVAFDYTTTATTIGPRWLRCYRGHASGLDPLEEPGSRDITADVLLDALPTPGRTTDQAAFLRAHGLDDLVRDGRQLWHDRAHVADLAALAARSRVAEAEALTDPSGLGGFTVAEWRTAPYHGRDARARVRQPR